MGCLFGKFVQLSSRSGCLQTFQPASKSFSQLSNRSAWFINRITLLCIIESGPTSLKTGWPVYKQVARLQTGQVCNQFATCTHYMHKHLPLFLLLTLELYFTVIYLTDFSRKTAILCPTARPKFLDFSIWPIYSPLPPFPPNPSSLLKTDSNPWLTCAKC